MVVRYLLKTVDGETVRVTFPEFLEANREMAREDLDAIRLLAPGETFHGGGGASPEWSITRPDTRKR